MEFNSVGNSVTKTTVSRRTKRHFVSLARNKKFSPQSRDRIKIAI